MELYDRFNRRIDYLRISVTDRCNLRCSYCMPEAGVEAKAHRDILSYEEIERFALAAVAAGISKIRLTGGEPLVRKDAVALVKMLAAIPGLRDMSLTTNGLLLPEFGDDLKAAGLKRVNISIDSLDSDVYRRLTRGGDLNKALAGLKKALELGFEPVKVNAVLMRGVNDDPKEFVELIHEYPVHVRFIEYMPVGAWDPKLYVSIDEFKANLARYGAGDPVEGPPGAGPATYFAFAGALGTIGFISPISNHFCGSCNRLRLTPDGKVRPCLFSDDEFDIRPKVRDNVSKDETIEFIREILAAKPERHAAHEKEHLKRLMYQIGG
ncbi:MAG: GTP 3',8-cyclase MoaA [Candidatus Aquicultor sp.]|nr:GTP 3',8-cyclase MoaA [Candidatus Aquicultor sp.]